MKKQFRSVVCAIGLLSGTLPAIAAGPHAFNGVKAGSGLSEPMSVQQQKKQIKGIVNDANGEPVIGATVLEKGTTNGTMTDIDGNFELSVSNGAVLQISYVGYVSQEITVGSNTSFNISLKEDSQLIDEVVVVGFGSQLI